VRRWNFALQKGFAEIDRQAPRGLRRQDTEQRPPGGHPGEGSLEDADEQVSLAHISHHERCDRTIRGEIGAEQDATGLDALKSQDVLKQSRRNVQHRYRVTHERQRCRQPLESLDIARDRQVAGAASRGNPQLRQVHGQPLLQLAGTARGDQGRPRRAAADVDQQARTIRLRRRADQRRRRGPRSAYRANRGDENHPPVHRPLGLA
jgi:hypothetical protein